jgi:hypothetical protein
MFSMIPLSFPQDTDVLVEKPVEKEWLKEYS